MDISRLAVSGSDLAFRDDTRSFLAKHMTDKLWQRDHETDDISIGAQRRSHCGGVEPSAS